MFAFPHLGRDITHDFVYSVNVAGDTAAVWFVESSPTEGASLGNPFLLWYRGVVIVVEFCDVGDRVGCVGCCFQFVVLYVVPS